MKAWLVLISLILSFPLVAHGQTEVALAGFAYAGSADGIADRFKYTETYINALKAENILPSVKINAALAGAPPQNLKLVPRIDELKGRDQALAASMVITAETVSVEAFGVVQKLFIQISAQALFFDFRSMTVLRAYPFSFAYVDVFNHTPSEDEIQQRIPLIYEGTRGNAGLFGRYAQALQTARLPAQVPRYVKVTQVSLAPEVMALIPDYIKGKPNAAETWVADMFSEALSSRAGIPVVPYDKGYAVGGVMAVSISDSDVYNLKLPTPDYDVTIDVTGVKKIKFSEAAAGASFVYGTYAKVTIEEPQSAHQYLHTDLKNGEVKVVPATQTTVDDFHAYVDSLKGLFTKLSDAIAGNENTWVKGAASASDIDRQIAQTKDLVKLCR